MSCQKGAVLLLLFLLFAPFSVLSRDFVSVETINGVNESIKAVCYTSPLAAALMHGSVHPRCCRDTDGSSPSPGGRRHRQLLTPSDRLNQSKYRAVLWSAKPQRSRRPTFHLEAFLCSRPCAFPGRFDAPHGLAALFPVWQRCGAVHNPDVLIRHLRQVCFQRYLFIHVPPQSSSTRISRQAADEEPGQRIVVDPTSRALCAHVHVALGSLEWAC